MHIRNVWWALVMDYSNLDDVCRVFDPIGIFRGIAPRQGVHSGKTRPMPVTQVGLRWAVTLNPVTGTGQAPAPERRAVDRADARHALPLGWPAAPVTFRWGPAASGRRVGRARC